MEGQKIIPGTGWTVFCKIWNPRHFRTEAFNFSPLIYAYQATNVALTGKGTIDGNSEHGFGSWRDHQRPSQSRLREMGAAGVPVHERIFDMDVYLRPSMIQFFGCNRILVEDVTVNDSPM